MKKLAIFLVAAMAVLSLTACAGTMGGGGAKVKCPACGHQFEGPR